MGHGRFCSIPCYARNRRASVPGYRPKTPEAHRLCEVCGNTFSVNPREGRRKVVCSPACQAAKYRENHPDYVAESRRQGRARRKATYVSPRYERKCRHCSEPFVAKRSNTIYCAKICRDRAFSAARRADGRTADQRAIRRALEIGVKITPGRRAAIFDADAYLCRLCGLETVPTLRYPNPLAPVIDHRKALSRGGVHGPANWQTAHSYCNSKKRDLPMEEFIATYPDIATQIMGLLEKLDPNRTENERIMKEAL